MDGKDQSRGWSKAARVIEQAIAVAVEVVEIGRQDLERAQDELVDLEAELAALPPPDADLELWRAARPAATTVGADAGAGLFAGMRAILPPATRWRRCGVCVPAGAIARALGYVASNVPSALGVPDPLARIGAASGAGGGMAAGRDRRAEGVAALSDQQGTSRGGDGDDGAVGGRPAGCWQVCGDLSVVAADRARPVGAGVCCERRDHHAGAVAEAPMVGAHEITCRRRSRWPLTTSSGCGWVIPRSLRTVPGDLRLEVYGWAELVRVWRRFGKPCPKKFAAPQRQ